MAGYLVAFALGVAVVVLTAGFYYARKKRTKEEIVQADKSLLETGEFYQKDSFTYQQGFTIFLLCACNRYPH
jgi:hypothetical protein